MGKKNILHIDIETYSSVDITKSGSYKYSQSPDFEILMVAYAFNDEPIEIVDLAKGEQLPKRFLKALTDPTYEKHAHNANFERNCFNAYGLETEIDQWHCSAVLAANYGLPISLEAISDVLKLGDKGKLSTGKALIRFFCCPIKPTKSNDFRLRNFYYHDLEKWEDFKKYCIGDVEAEREILKRLNGYAIPETERKMYILDQKINDNGILVDLTLAQSAVEIDKINSARLTETMKDLTGLENPKSPAQLMKWLEIAMKKEIKSIAKDSLAELLNETESDFIKEVLKLRQKISKTSIKKYTAALNCAGYFDNRARGLFQFYGANRTGRWAGRLVQLQNLRRNGLDNIDRIRELCKKQDIEGLLLMFDDISDVLSQLIRTVFIAPEGYTFAVSDFSAIEARVIAWLANEKWRIDVFSTHGKIYEASAAMMFGIDITDVTKGSDYRQKGKIAELALGYQGSLGALLNMGGDSMGLSELEMKNIVALWRKKSPNIVKLWDAVNKAAIRATETKKEVVLKQFKNLAFRYEFGCLTIELPSGRKLVYQEAQITQNRFGQKSVKYKGLDQETKKWFWIDSYGGKFVENIVQAIARDLLVESLIALDEKGLKIVMHVHDEIVCEVEEKNSEKHLSLMNEIMSREIDWAKGLPLGADGYLTNFYKKD